MPCFVNHDSTAGGDKPALEFVTTCARLSRLLLGAMYSCEYSIRNAGFATHRIWDIEYRGRYESINSHVQQDRTPVEIQNHCQFNVTLIP